jgi:hypothetical protein
VHQQCALGVDDDVSIADCLDPTWVWLDVNHIGGHRGREPSGGILAERTAPGDQAHPAVLTPALVTGMLDSHRVTELGEKLLAIVAADEVVRHRDPDRGGCRDVAVGPGKQPMKTLAHDREHP